MSDICLRVFERKDGIEDSIDFATAINTNECISVKLYVYVLSNLVSAFNADNSGYTRSQLTSYIKHNKNIRRIISNQRLYKAEEYEYLKKLKVYIKEIKVTLLGVQSSQYKNIKLFTDSILGELKSITSNEDLIELLKEKANLFSFFNYSIGEKRGNITIFFHNRISYLLYLVNNFDTYEEINVTHKYGVILTNQNDYKLIEKIVNRPNIDFIAIKSSEGFFESTNISLPLDNSLSLLGEVILLTQREGIISLHDSNHKKLIAISNSLSIINKKWWNYICKYNELSLSEIHDAYVKMKNIYPQIEESIAYNLSRNTTILVS